MFSPIAATHEMMERFKHLSNCLHADISHLAGPHFGIHGKFPPFLVETQCNNDASSI